MSKRAAGPAPAIVTDYLGHVYIVAKGLKKRCQRCYAAIGSPESFAHCVGHPPRSESDAQQQGGHDDRTE